MYPRKKTPRPWDGYMEPFKIVDSVYYVGVYQVCTHLIDTGDGLFLIDAGYSNCLYMIIDSIHRLGFDPRDIKYIFSTHRHSDHTEANAALSKLSGAKIMLGELDAVQDGLYRPDILLRDGDRFTLGDKTFEFMHTPGHTKGTMSVFFDVVDNGRVLRAGMFGGAGANTLTRSTSAYYPGCVDDYLRSLDRLEKEHVDVFLGNHVWNNNCDEIARQNLEAKENLFINDKAFGEFIAFCRKRCLDTVKKDEENDADPSYRKQVFLS